MILNAPTKTYELGFGRIGVPRNTAMKMRDLIHESSKNLYVRKWAEHIIQNVENRDEYGEANAVFTFLQTKARYAHDPRGLEFIQTPPYILKHIELGLIPSLDCDDYTVLSLAMLRSIGYETGIRVTGYKPDGRFTHVYGMAKIDGKWTAFDPIRKEVPMGWEAPGAKRRMDIEV